MRDRKDDDDLIEFLVEMDCGILAGGDAGYSAGDFGGATSLSDWYATGDYRMPSVIGMYKRPDTRSKKSKKRKSKKKKGIK